MPEAHRHRGYLSMAAPSASGREEARSAPFCLRMRAETVCAGGVRAGPSDLFDVGGRCARRVGRTARAACVRPPAGSTLHG